MLIVWWNKFQFTNNVKKIYTIVESCIVKLLKFIIIMVINKDKDNKIKKTWNATNLWFGKLHLRKDFLLLSEQDTWRIDQIHHE